MRNRQNTTITTTESLTDGGETNWSLPGAIIGFAAWLLALGVPFLFYGSNTLFFFLYTWPFFLALLPVAIIVGIALHSLVNGKLLYSIMLSVATIAVMFGSLFMWLMG